MPIAVCRKTLPSSASTAAARSPRCTGTGAGPSAPANRHCRPSSSASADQNATRSRITSAASQPTVTAGASTGERRAERMIWSTSRSNWETACRVASAASPSPSEAAFSRSTVSGVRSRCDRSAANSRSAASSCTTRSAMALNAAAASWSSAGLPSASRPSTGTRTARLPAPSERAAAASRLAEPTIREPIRSATSTATATRPSATSESTSQAVSTPRVRSPSGT